MKRAIRILQQKIQAYRDTVMLYEGDPNNQAVTKFTADDAANGIEELTRAIKVFEENEPKEH